MDNRDKELLDLLTETLPPARRARLRPAATLRELGLDSLGLMLVVSRFVERHPISTDAFQSQLERVRTVEDLLEVGRRALACSPAGAP